MKKILLFGLFFVQFCSISAADELIDWQATGRGILNAINYEEYSPILYTAPTIPSAALSGWTTPGAGTDISAIFTGAAVSEIIEGANADSGSQDWGRQLFGSLFGIDWMELTANATTSPTTPNSADSVLFTLLYGLNIVALVAVALILAYTIAMGGIGTSAQGTPGGKNINSIFTPLRSAMAVGYLAPTMKGLSILQVLLLAGFGWSNNFSNYLWGGMLDYMHDNGGQIVAKLPATTDSSVDKVGQIILQGLTAQAYQVSVAGAQMTAPVASGVFVSDGWFSQTASPDWLEASADDNIEKIEVFINRPTSALGDDLVEMAGVSNYGSIEIPCDSKTEGGLMLCNAHNQALQNLINDLVPVANKIVGSQVPGQLIMPPSQMEYQLALEEYKSAIADLYPTLVDSTDTGFQEGLDRFIEQSKIDGWMSAGSYYWTLARYNEHIAEVLGAFPEGHAMDREEFAMLPGGASAFLSKVTTFTNRAATAEDVARGGSSTDSAWSNSKKYISSAVQQISIDKWIDKLGEGGNPVTVLSGLGHGTMTAAEVLFGGYLAAKGIAAAAESTSDNWLIQLIAPVGAAAKAVTSGTEAVLDAAGLPITTAAAFLLGIGGFLAFYLPAIPFVLWLFGIVGLMIMVLEMLFAAPVWAAAHAIPEGEGMAGQYAKQGYAMYINVLLRAPLMLCGLFTAIISFSALAQLTARALHIYVASATGERILGPVSVIAFLMLATLIYVWLAHKTFNLITHLPEKALSWIGHSGGGFFEVQEERTMSNTVQQGTRGGMQQAGYMGRSSSIAKPSGTVGDDMPGKM